jgi:hypothetical protein
LGGSFFRHANSKGRRPIVEKTPETKSKDKQSQAEMVEQAEIEQVELARAAKRARDRAVDDGDAAHMGGAGAQGGQTDFGNPKPKF